MTPLEVAEMRRQIVGTIASHRDGGFMGAFSRCESPIEQAYCITLFQADGVHAIPGDFEPAALTTMATDRPRVFVFAQQPIEPFRADFLLVGRSPLEAEPRFVIVECDGAEYHSSPEQQKYDRRRQAALQKTGFRVVRFTGTELYREPRVVLRRSLEQFSGFDARQAARRLNEWELKRAFVELGRLTGT